MKIFWTSELKNIALQPKQFVHFVKFVRVLDFTLWGSEMPRIILKGHHSLKKAKTETDNRLYIIKS